MSVHGLPRVEDIRTAGAYTMIARRPPGFGLVPIRRLRRLGGPAWVAGTGVGAEGVDEPARVGDGARALSGALPTSGMQRLTFREAPGAL